MSVRRDEIEYAWDVIEEVYRLEPRCEIYERGTQGPPSLDAFIAAFGKRWPV